MPLLSIIEEPSTRSKLKALALEAYSNIVAERSLSIEAHVLEIVVQCMGETEHAVVSIQEVTTRMIQQYGSEYDRPITNRWIGSVLRKRLHLRTYKSHGIYVIPTSERTKVAQLCARFGVEVEFKVGITEAAEGQNQTVQSGDVGTSGTQ